MSHWQRTLPAAALLLLAAAGCKPAEQQPQQPAAAAGPAPGTPEFKIANAMSAAPAAVAGAATVLEILESPDSQPRQIRAGTNGWTCLTDNPATPGNDPICGDAHFMEWVTAWLAHRPPHVTSVGFAYMLQGGTDASNTDPFKMRPDSGQPWVDTGPHVMIMVPSASGLAGISTDTHSGAPYVMWSGTPYAHVMMPVAAGGAAHTM